MDLGNLATVITPSILKANRRDGMHDESFPGIRVVTELLEVQDELYLVPAEFIPIIHDQNYFIGSLEQPRELLKKIDTFLRLRHGPSSAPMSRPSASNGASYQEPSMSAPYHPAPSNYANGSQQYERPGTTPHPSDYASKSLPPHPGLSHQPFSSPHPTSRTPDHTSMPQRPSLDAQWAPPPIPISDSRRDSPRSRPNSFLRPSDSSLPSSYSSTRNSPIGQ